jgi:hypothetical protein
MFYCRKPVSDNMEEIYLAAFEKSNIIHLPAASAVALFVLKYCKKQSFKLYFVRRCSCESEYPIRLTLDKCHDASLLQAEECPHSIRQCVLPAVKCYNENKVLSGLCGVLRYIIKVSAKESTIPDLLKLLVRI